MDDINAIKDFRSGTAPMSAACEDTIRARLGELAAAGGEGPDRPGTHRPRSRRLVLRVGIATALTAATATGITVVQGLDGDGAPAAEAAQFGDRAAKAVEGRPYVPPRPGQWVYTKTAMAAGFDMNTWWKGVDRSRTETGEHWTRVDGEAYAWSWKGRVRVQEFKDRPATADSPGVTYTRPEPAYSMRNYHTLPADPDALLRRLYAAHYPDQVGRTGPGSVFAMLNEMLQNPIPPRLQAAVYRALPKIPGVRLRRGVRDQTGRVGDAFAFVDGRGERTSAIIDPSTYRYLGTGAEAARDIPVHEGPDGKAVARAGTLLSWHAYLTVKIVDRPGER
ncbi:CU044_5270 family protein [Actinomadura graeca]|uniref:CU044_5270 family protein n=1 Tax=Actinomadura graeca TaxID=2750812 RepID=A0ABX8QX05_9ACTN|nr:CU044_5270 family protein [Actinomadura graeca]QXJ23376.1 CU044_5270 family protein [Actinomadura graeca]